MNKRKPANKGGPLNSAGASALLEPVLKRFGAPVPIPLDVPLCETAQLSYLDLLPKRSGERGAGISAVVEHQGNALLYLVDALGRTATLHPQDIHEKQHVLANRSESAWLGIVKPGSLDLYPVEFSDHPPQHPTRTIVDDSPEAPLFFQGLAHGTFRDSGKLPGNDYVYRQILELLKHTTDTFVPQRSLDGLEILSMTGRALFFRFLHDRRIVEEKELATICPSAAKVKGATLKDVFSNPTRAAETSAWLDATFNGDFLPLPLTPAGIPSEDQPRRQRAYAVYYKGVQNRAADLFNHLDAIMHGWEGRAGNFQPKLDWNELQFAHIPVGVLSEVYEHFSHKVDPAEAARTSVHYTPRIVAQFMVDEAFGALAKEVRPVARVLDPSCGAGIFLVLSFRKLFEAAWEASGERPDKKVIQRLLYQQLRGFDVSEPALRLSALALYITAIELNATQRPPAALKMPKNLRGTVLHHFGHETAQEVYGEGKKAQEQGLLGSLGELPNRDGMEQFDGSFDLVIGNPPWTRWRGDESAKLRASGVTKRAKNSSSNQANKVFTQIGKRVLQQRGLMDLAKKYTNPDSVPDLPFLWRAGEWAKIGGTIAFAIHARLFSHTQGKKEIAWQSVLSAFNVTGILNGSDLRKTPVWEGMDIPWSLVYARNHTPSEQAGFYFSTPCYERPINGAGRFRIDYASVNPLRSIDLETRPWLLKTLTLGTWLDVDVMGKIISISTNSLREYWERNNSKKKSTGQGYNISPGHGDEPSEFLNGLLDFQDPQEGGFGIDWDTLKTFGETYPGACPLFPRSKELYQPPLVIIPKAPGVSHYTPKAFISDRALSFSQSYYGFSCAGFQASIEVAALIYVLAHSLIVRYFTVMRSSSLGSDFMMFLKNDFDSIPFPNVSEFSPSQSQCLLDLSSRLSTGEGGMPETNSAGDAMDLPGFGPAKSRAIPSDGKKALAFWAELNAFVSGLYGLGEEEIQVMEDTLFSAAPYRREGAVAFEPTTVACRGVFCDELQKRLQPFFSITDEVVRVEESPGLRQEAWDHTWRFLTAWVGDVAPSVPPSLIAAAMRDANETGASIVTVRTKGRGLLIGVLDARRWWTRSRALLCARHILQDKLTAFDEKPAAKRK